MWFAACVVFYFKSARHTNQYKIKSKVSLLSLSFQLQFLIPRNDGNETYTTVVRMKFNFCTCTVRLGCSRPSAGDVRACKPREVKPLTLKAECPVILNSKNHNFDEKWDKFTPKFMQLYILVRWYDNGIISVLSQFTIIETYII